MAICICPIYYGMVFHSNHSAATLCVKPNDKKPDLNTIVKLHTYY